MGCNAEPSGFTDTTDAKAKDAIAPSLNGVLGLWPASTSKRHSFRIGDEPRATIPHAVA
jgi:hypothetical protein